MLPTFFKDRTVLIQIGLKRGEWEGEREESRESVSQTCNRGKFVLVN